MSAQIKYSVVIPVYNREATISRCLESLVSQGRCDIQILVIDDGSLDTTGKIVLEFASSYHMIQYYRQPNAGVSCARNTGLDLVLGQYVTFVDSDDYVSPDYFSALDRALTRQDCELLVFQKSGFGGFFPDESPIFARLCQLTTDHERLKLLLSSRLIMQPVNKCFKTDIIRKHHLRFIDGLHIGEDFTFCMMYAMRCSRIAISSELLYFLDLSDPTSLSRNYRPNLDQKMVQVFNYVNTAIHSSDYWQDHQQSLTAILDYLYIKNVCTCIAEEFKVGKSSYLRNRKDFAAICHRFRQPISDARCGVIHRVMRLFLKWNWYFPFYIVSFSVKRRKFLPRNRE